MIKLFDIFKIYFIVGCQLIGGGYVILPLLKKYLVIERKWVKEEELIDYLAISQCLPGIIALNISVFSGWKLRKIKGSIVAVFGLILPSFLIIILISSILSKLVEFQTVQNMFFGIRLSMIVLLFFMIYDAFKASVKSFFPLILFFLILFCMLYTNLTPAMLIIAAVIISVLRGNK